jgi:hypothetical protein
MSSEEGLPSAVIAQFDQLSAGARDELYGMVAEYQSRLAIMSRHAALAEMILCFMTSPKWNRFSLATALGVVIEQLAISKTGEAGDSGKG